MATTKKSAAPKKVGTPAKIPTPQKASASPAAAKKAAPLSTAQSAKKSIVVKASLPKVPSAKASAKKAPAKVPPKKVAAKAPAVKAPAVKAPAKRAPAVKAPAKRAPAVKAPAKRAPAVKAPAVKAPAVKAPAKRAPAVKAPAVKAPAVKAPAVKAPVKKAPVKKAPAVEAPVKKAPVKKAPAKEVGAKAKSPAKGKSGFASTGLGSNKVDQALAEKAPAPVTKKPAGSSARPGPVVLEIPAPRGVSKDGIAYTKDFDVKFLKAQWQMLIEERSHLLGQAVRLEDEAHQLIEEAEMGDVQFDDEGGEGDTMVVERERDLALSAQARETITEIDEAIARIQVGTYGYSKNSGRLIPRERLEALPWATELVSEKVGGIGRR